MSEVIKVFLSHLNCGYLAKLREGLSYVDFAKIAKPGDLIFIKPNLTFPYYRKGVMTNPECIKELVIALKDYSANIIIGEADGGGYNRFSMDEVFKKIGLNSIANQYGVKLFNLSKLSSRNIYFGYKRKDFAVPLPELLLDEIKVFITVPVPKVHANTGISISIKNQWGCIQDPSLRLKLHPYFKEVILEINKALKVNISIIDGRYGLNINGPMKGEAVELNWLIVANNILAADTTCCKLMGIYPDSIGYLRYYRQNENIEEIENFHCNVDPADFVGPRFRLRREFLDYPGYFAFRSSLLAYLAYQSPLAKYLHKVLYIFRDKFYEYKQP